MKRDYSNSTREELLGRLLAYDEEMPKTIKALQDLTDGESWWDIQYTTGLNEERCKEILALAWGSEKGRNGR